MAMIYTGLGRCLRPRSVEGSGRRSLIGVVRAEGLEPPRLSSREPKSRASTNSATPAKGASPPKPAGGAAYNSQKRRAHDKNMPPFAVLNPPERQ
jgi:hypothetical protein